MFLANQGNLQSKRLFVNKNYLRFPSAGFSPLFSPWLSKPQRVSIVLVRRSGESYET